MCGGHTKSFSGLARERPLPIVSVSISRSPLCLQLTGLGPFCTPTGGLGNRLDRFKGVGAAGNVAFSFFGSFKRKFRRILGEAVSNVGGGVAFVFSGRRREGCGKSSVDPGNGALGSPYFEAE